MSHFVERRDFLKAVFGCTAAASLGALKPAHGREPWPSIESVRLGDSLMLFTADGGNIIVARDGDGLALVDGGLPEHARELLHRIRDETGAKHVHTLFNTHWHPRQTGLNERVGKEGATIIAHENTRLWLCYANPVSGCSHDYGPLPPHARPNKTFFNGAEQIAIGNEPVEYGYLMQAHTDGDMYVLFKKSNVLATGGVVSGAGWPTIDYQTGGWIVGMTRGLETLIKVADADTRVIPAHGPPLTRADLVQQHEMYSTISVRLEKAIRNGLGPEEIAAQKPTAEFDAKWGDSREFVTTASKSLWGHFAPDAT